MTAKAGARQAVAKKGRRNQPNGGHVAAERRGPVDKVAPLLPATAEDRKALELLLTARELAKAGAVGKLRLLADEAAEGRSEEEQDTAEEEDASAVMAAAAKIVLLPFLVWAAVCWAWRTGSAVCGAIAEAVDKSGEVVQESAQTYDEIDIGDSEDEFDVAPGRRRPVVEQREAPPREEVLLQQADETPTAPPPPVEEPVDPGQDWHEVEEDPAPLVVECVAPPESPPFASEPPQEAASPAPLAAAVENGAGDGAAAPVWPDEVLAAGDAAAVGAVEAVGSSDTDEEQFQGAVRVAEEVLRDTAGASVTFESSQQDVQDSLHEEVADMGSLSDQAGVEHHPADAEDGNELLVDTEVGQEEDVLVEENAGEGPAQQVTVTAVDEPSDAEEVTAPAQETHANGDPEPEAAPGCERTQDREVGEIPVSPATGSVVGVWEYNELEVSSDRSGCQSTPALPRASPRAPDAVVRSGPGTIRSATGSSVSWADMSEEDGDADASSLVSGHLLPPKQGKHRKAPPARKAEVWKPSLRTCAQ
mmetsp:Transcript_92242/g.246629  ORF Transcript_92242/g.246629 Transcript_92242/m.246629 type:complete len:533 (+) Transcript_92242:34-1632(+)